MRYGLKGKARTHPDFFRVGFGPCANFTHVRPRSKNGAKHQNINQKRHSFDLDTIRKNKQFKIKKVKIG